MNADAFRKIVESSETAAVAGDIDEQRILRRLSDPEAPPSCQDGTRDHRTTQAGAARRRKRDPYRASRRVGPVAR
jgi:hypothetical protein